MDGEIDLESYTIAIIRLNTAFLKIENNENVSDIKNLFNESFNDLNRLYEDIVNDLNHGEVNFNEYYLFFNNGKEVFPQFIEVLTNIDNPELEDIVKALINVFTNLNRIADAFGQEMKK